MVFLTRPEHHSGHFSKSGRAARVKRTIAVFACASILAGFSAVTATRPAQAEDTGTIHPYAATGVGPDVVTGATTSSPDVASTKYTVSADDTGVEAVQYNKLGHNYDIARFSSSSRTPDLTVTLTDGTLINSVNIYPARYYPSDAVTVSADKKSLTFQMSASADLNYVIVMVNGDSTNASGQPYLAIVNDPLEDSASRPDTTSAADSSGVNTQTGVLNFQEFATAYLKAHPNSTAQTAVAPTTSQVAGQTLGGSTISATQQTSQGTLVPATTVNVRYPNQRIMSANDVTYAMQAAMKQIVESNGEINTLYFPDGTYVGSGLEINGVDGSKLKGGKLKVYVDEGALILNRIQAYQEAMEPAIGIWNSSNVEIDGRGVIDGNGVANYDAVTSGDKHDAITSQHQGGVMVMHSSDITFNDTYVRNVKQWNWETHTAKNVTLNNIKGLTPYALPWVDGTDFASGQNITANEVFTLGNDDAFASGHYNPSNGFGPTVSGTQSYYKLGTASADLQGFVNAVAAYYAVKDLIGWDSNSWDNADSSDISVTNTLNWTVGPGNGIRLGHQALGYQLKNYTFDNFNPIGQQTSAIAVQNNTNIYPRYQNVTIKNSSFDTSRTGGMSINGGDGGTHTITADMQQNQGYAPNPDGSGSTYTINRTPIPSVTLDNVWFSNKVSQSMSYITDATLNNIYVGGKLVTYTNQFGLATSNVTTLNFTYTDANGATQDVAQNSPPTFTAPTTTAMTATNDNVLRFTVAATDPDPGDNVVLAATGLPSGATFDPSTGIFQWKPGSGNVGSTYPVTFTAADKGAQAGAYDPTTTAVKISVVSSEHGVSSIATTGDTYVGAWSGDQATNKSADLTLITRNTGQGLMGEKYTTGSGDGKISYVQFDLSNLSSTDLPSQASLQLTYVGHRASSTSQTDNLIVTPVSDATCTGGASSCPVSTMTWKSQPSFTATSDNTASSASFSIGTTVVPEGGGTHQTNAIDGRKISVDVTSFVKSAVTAGQKTLLLAVSNASSTNELRFVSAEGAASGGLTNATADMAPTLALMTVKPGAVTGPTSQTLYEGTTGSTDPFTLTGASPFSVALTGDTAGGRISWNSATNSLAFAEGISAGTHTLSIDVTTSDGQTASLGFTLTVKANAVTSIAVTKQPNTTQYTVGDSFDKSGLEVTATMADATTRVLDPSEYTVTAPNLMGVGTQNATVSLNSDSSVTAQFSVTVKAPVFSDVSSSTMFYKEISWLANQGVTTGWVSEDGTRYYQPLAEIHRDAMAAYLYRLAGSPQYTAPPTSPFTDLKPTDEYYKQICWLKDEGITTGYSDGTYRPLDPVNRDAMAAFLYRYDKSPEFTAPSTSPFTDVQPTDQFYKEMAWLNAQGISTGWPDGTYRPTTPVARDAMAAFLFRLKKQG